MGFGEFLAVELKRSVSSMLPWDIPWYDPSHAVFFTALYAVLTVLALGLAWALIATILRLKKDE
ncbi:MAG: hypothetical protein JRI45_10930 [Deltaproteobacteria bacterium]|nr:hypothetical protein [Deltaproteobacteria bacterium]MBW2069309.1 hypothetical protein [Deltaproteobacteria bacterium]